MPAKKTNSTQTTEKKGKTNKKVESILTNEVHDLDSHTKDNLEQKLVFSSEINNNSEAHHDNSEVQDLKKNNIVRKTGRTLLVSPPNGAYLNDSIFNNLFGLSTSHSTKNGSYFLTFDDINNALDSFRNLRQDHPELRVKFARYQIFFTISGLTDSNDYSIVKQNMCNFIEQETDTNVLYFKLYRKGDKYIGCGDLTVDTKDAMDKLLNKEGHLKNYTIGELSGTFYRYNKTPNKLHEEDHDHA